MSWYKIIRPLLFKLPPESAHKLVLGGMNYVPSTFFQPPVSAAIDAMGIRFPSCVGLAAGFDKNGAHLSALAKLGFAYVEVGTVTPKPQLGNPKPRLFRLPSASALINRMGFNNAGVHVLVENIRMTHYQGILGINIGKNKETSLNAAAQDYQYCMRAVYPYASYITVNVSSPNTPDLRQLQHGDFFANLMTSLVEEHKRLTDQYHKVVPIVVKLSPDESDETLKRVTNVLLQPKIASAVFGIIATNTTCSRNAVQGLPHAEETGGLSGSPLRLQALACLKLLKQEVGTAMTLIGSGGIDSVDAARERLDAGASLVQVYTGLIYEGPQLISEIACLNKNYDRS